MFDLHYHLIFGVDDGPKTIEDSLALAEASIAEGVTHIVATPHANDRYKFQLETNRERLEILKERLGGRLTLGLGCDFHLSYDNILDLRKDPSRYTINGKQYLLVEIPDLAIPGSIADVFFNMRVLGVTPIVTHPERNPVIMTDPQCLVAWIEMGCLVQVTAASLSGDFGRKSQAVALEMVRLDHVHIIASDAHWLKGRPPSMRCAYSILRDKFGRQTADRLCIHNPRAVFLGEELPPQPEPHVSLSNNSRGIRGFFNRLFG